MASGLPWLCANLSPYDIWTYPAEIHHAMVRRLENSFSAGGKRLMWYAPDPKRYGSPPSTSPEEDAAGIVKGAVAPTTRHCIDYGGMIHANEPFEKLQLDGLMISVRSLHADILLEDLGKTRIRRGALGITWCEHRAWPGLRLCLTFELAKQLREQIVQMLPQINARIAEHGAHLQRLYDAEKAKAQRPSLR